MTTPSLDAWPGLGAGPGPGLTAGAGTGQPETGFGPGPATGAGPTTGPGSGSAAGPGLGTGVSAAPLSHFPRSRPGRRVCLSRAVYRRERLRLPSGLATPLGYDAIGVAAALGARVRHGLPRMGCVFADTERWWWIVPENADVGLRWPAAAHYSPGAVVATPRGTRTGPRLTHWPEDNVPYTHPIVLYIVLCHALGVAPEWSRPTTI